MLNSETLCEAEEMECDTFSIASTGESSRNNDRYSLEDINQFLDEMYHRFVKNNMIMYVTVSSLFLFSFFNLSVCFSVLTFL